MIINFLGNSNFKSKPINLSGLILKLLVCIISILHTFETCPWTFQPYAMTFVKCEALVDSLFWPRLDANWLSANIFLKLIDKWYSSPHNNSASALQPNKGPCPNMSTTPITAMGYRQCLPLSVVQLIGKHCQKPHCCNGVVDTFKPCLFVFSYIFEWPIRLKKWKFLALT